MIHVLSLRAFDESGECEMCPFVVFVSVNDPGNEICIEFPLC